MSLYICHIPAFCVPGTTLYYGFKQLIAPRFSHVNNHLTWACLIVKVVVPWVVSNVWMACKYKICGRSFLCIIPKTKETKNTKHERTRFKATSQRKRRPIYISDSLTKLKILFVHSFFLSFALNLNLKIFFPWHSRKGSGNLDLAVSGSHLSKIFSIFYAFLRH